MSPRRSLRRLDRPTNRRRQKDHVLIVCEGTVTEVEYLTGLRDFFKALPVEIVDCEIIGRGCDPRSVVGYAIQRRDLKRAEANRRRDSSLAYDQVWCAVDVDDHTTLDDAIVMARRSGVDLIVSRPCFDLWLLYHFQKYAARSTPKEIRRKLNVHIPGYDKHVPRDFPYGRHGTARSNAEEADPEHRTPNRKGANPSTNAWLLVEVIRASGRGS